METASANSSRFRFSFFPIELLAWGALIALCLVHLDRLAGVMRGLGSELPAWTRFAFDAANTVRNAPFLLVIPLAAWAAIAWYWCAGPREQRWRPAAEFAIRLLLILKVAFLVVAAGLPLASCCAVIR